MSDARVHETLCRIGPRNEAEALLFAEEALIFDMQEAICSVMRLHRVTRRDLEQSMGLPRGSVRRLLSGESELSLRMAARMLYHAGGRFCVSAVAQPTPTPALTARARRR